jgi:hypothetical protein
MPSSLESAQPEAPCGPTMRRTTWALKRSEYLTKSVLAHPTLAARSGPRVTMGGDNFPDTGGDPAARRGAYVDPATGAQRILVHPNATPTHGHVNSPSGQCASRTIVDTKIGLEDK